MKKSFSLSTLFILVVFLTMIMTFGISRISENTGYFAYGDEYLADGSMADIHAEFYNNGYWDGASPKMGCYPISSQLDLGRLSELVINGARINGCVFYMTNDIDLTGFEGTIGDDNTPFLATFDGCGYTLSNYEYSNPNMLYSVGLFSCVEREGIVRRVNLSYADIFSFQDGSVAGGLVGLNHGLIEECSVSHSEISAIGGVSAAGGLFGFNEGSVLNSYATYTTLTAYDVYGLGYNSGEYQATITNSFAYEMEYFYTSRFYPISSREGVENCFWYASDYEDSYIADEMMLRDYFSLGKVCLWLNGANWGTGSKIFGQDLTTDEHPIFLREDNYERDYVYAVNFFYEDIFYDLAAVNFGGKVSALPTPYWIESDGTITYMCEGSVFSIETEVFKNCKVDTSGGTMIKDADGLLLSNESTGKGTKTSPLVISTKEDLLVLANASRWDLPVTTSDGDTCIVSSAYIELANDITFNDLVFIDNDDLEGFFFKITHLDDEYFFSPIDGCIFIYDPLGEEYTEIIDAKLASNLYSYLIKWPTISYLEGCFDGKGYSINGLYSHDEEVGFVFALYGTVKNLNIQSYFIGDGYNPAGSIAGAVINGNILNCTSDSYTYNYYYELGGIAGNANCSVIDNCVSKGVISPYEGEGSAYVGGLVGYSYLTLLSNCTNYAEIKASPVNDVGGIVGAILGYGPDEYTKGYDLIVNCVNYSSISGKNYVGGIVGIIREFYGDKMISLQNCVNYGDMDGNQYIGGILGGTDGRGNVEIINCVNFGDIKESEGIKAQIIGYYNIYSEITLNHCFWDNSSPKAAAYYYRGSEQPPYSNCTGFYMDPDDMLVLDEGIILSDGSSTYSLIEALNMNACTLPFSLPWEEDAGFIYFSNNYSTLTYHPNAEAINPVHYYFNDSVTIVFPPFEREKYSLIGFSYDNEALFPDPSLFEGQVIFPPSNNSTLIIYAVWEKNYEIQFINNINDLNEVITFYLPRSEDTIEAINSWDYELFSPQMFALSGWATSPEVTYLETENYYSVGEEIPVSGDMLLYSVWMPMSSLKGFGSKKSPFLIESVEDLNELANIFSQELYFDGAFFKQTKDIVLNEFFEIDGTKYLAFKNTSEITIYYNLENFEFYNPNDLTNPLSDHDYENELASLLNIISIGNDESPFIGIYDGNFKTIYGIVGLSDSTEGSLFGLLWGATIKNLRIKNGALFENSMIAPLATEAIYSSFINCVIEDVDFYFNILEEEGEYPAGGIVGFSYDSSFVNCLVDINIIYEEPTEYTGDHALGGLAFYQDLMEAFRASNCVVNIDIITRYELNDPPDDFLIFPLSVIISSGGDLPVFEFSDFYYRCSLNGDLFNNEIMLDYNDAREKILDHCFAFEHDPSMPSGFSASSKDLVWLLNANSSRASNGTPFISIKGMDNMPTIADFSMVDIVDENQLAVSGTLESDWLTVYLAGSGKDASDIYYTIDGSSPITNGIFYTGSPLNMTHGITLSVVERINGIYGGVKTLTFKKAIYLEYKLGNAISGDLPIDNTPYEYGQTIPLQWANNLLGKNENDFFIGWTTTLGSSIANMTIIADYIGGDNIITLYPVFKSSEGISTWDGSMDFNWFYSYPNKESYDIYTAAEFAGFAYLSSNYGGIFGDVTIKLQSDLDLLNIPWEPIHEFTGFFEGNNHVIYNLSSTSQDYAGLFGSMFGGTLQNLGLVGGKISSLIGIAGGGVAYAEDSTIRNFWLEGITLSGEGVGGIVGFADNCEIINCFSSAIINSLPYSYYLGGITALTYNSTVQNCVFYGQINHTLTYAVGEFAGVVVGVHNTTENIFYRDNNLDGVGVMEIWFSMPYPNINISTILYDDGKLIFASWSETEAANEKNINLLDALNEGATIYSKVWLNSGWEENEWGVCLLSGETDDSAKILSWLDEGNFDTSWYFENTAGTLFHIHTEEELAGLSYIVNSSITSFKGKTIYLENDLNMEGKAWMYIGDFNRGFPFEGTFDGRGHTISNLFVPSVLNWEYAGLFGSVHKAFILNVGVINCNLAPSYCAGALVVESFESIIVNCYTTGKLSSLDQVGGIVGYFDYDSIMVNCWTSCEILSQNSMADLGYLAGLADSNYSFENCFWLEREGYSNVSNDYLEYYVCHPFYIEDGEYLFDTEVEYEYEDYTSLVSILNAFVLYNYDETHTLAKYAMKDGNPTFDGYYPTYDVIFNGSGIYVYDGPVGKNALVHGEDLVLKLFPSTGYTLNGLSITITMGEVTIDNSIYSFEHEVFGNLYIPHFAINGDIIIEISAIKNHFSISKASSSEGFLISPSIAQYDSKVRVLPVPDEGYYVASVQYQKECGSYIYLNYNEITREYEFTMPGQDVHLEVTYEGIDYSISLFDSAGYTIEGEYSIVDDKEEGNKGDLITIIVTPYEFYVVDSVSYTLSSGQVVNVVKVAGSYSFEMPADDITVKVTFSKPWVVINCNPSSNGFIQASLSSAIAGTEVVISPIPDEGYTVDKVFYIDNFDENQEIFPSEGEYSLAIPAYSSIAFFATFKEIEYNIDIEFREILNSSVTIKNSENTSISTACMGDEITVETSIDSPGILTRLYYLDDIGDYFPISLTTKTFTMPASSVTICAEFFDSDINVRIDGTTVCALTHIYTDIDCTTLMQESAATGVTLYLKTKYNTGLYSENPSFSINPSDDLGLTKISSSDSENIYSITTPLSDPFNYVIGIYDLNSTFYSLSLYDTNGTLENGNSYSTTCSSYAYGATVTISTTIATGYEILSVTYSYAGTDYNAKYNSSEGKYYFTMPPSEATLRVIVKPIDYLIQKTPVSEGKGGYIASSLTANYGDTITITPSPDDGYRVNKIKYYSNIQAEYIEITESNSVYSFSMPPENIAIEVEFELISYALYYPNSTNEGGGHPSKTPGSSSVANFAYMGEKIYLVMHIYEGYKLKTITVTANDLNQTIPVNYSNNSFIMPNSEVTLSFEFDTLPYVVNSQTATLGGLVRVSLDDSQPNTILDSVRVGEEVEILATPEPGYAISKVYHFYYMGSSQIKTYVEPNEDGRYTFAMPARDVVAEVLFSPIPYSITIISSGSGQISIQGEDEVLDWVYIKNYMEVLVEPADYSRLKSLYYVLDENVVPITYQDGDYYIFSMPAGDIEVVAEFERIEYSITYKGHNLTIIDSETYNFDDTLTLISAPVRMGYTFVGWEIESISGNWVEHDLFEEGVSLSNRHGSVTLIASYNRIDYTYDFGSKPYTYNIEDSNISFPKGEILKGYSFEGWKVVASEGSWEKDSMFDALQAFPQNSYGNVSFVEVYQLIEYIASFDTNGGSLVDSLTYDIDSPLTLPSASSKLGYTFDGWKVTASDSESDWEIYAVYSASKVFPKGSVTGNVTLTAQWSINTYIVTINSDGGTPVNALNYDITSDLTLPASITKLGYTFTGWKVTETDNASDWEIDDILSASQAFSEGTVTGNLTLTAQWSLTIYTLTIEADGGTAIDSSTYDILTALVLPEKSSKRGYAFAGWIVTSAEENSGWEIEAILSASETFSQGEVLGDVTLTARWARNIYIASFEVDDETVDSFTYHILSTPTLPRASTKLGYTFMGWKVTSASEGSDWEIGEIYDASYTFTQGSYIGSVTFTAQWSIATYTITINPDGGTPVDALSYNILSPLTLPASITKLEHTFAGWKVTETDNTSVWEIGEILSASQAFSEGSVTGNVTLTAQWSITTYTITINSDGGPSVNALNYDITSVLTLPASITKSGYTFTGWKVTETDNASDWEIDEILSASQAFSEGTVTGNVTLTAQWSITTYTITINSDGGTPVDALSYNITSALTLPASIARAGYTFTGWKVTTASGNWTLNGIYSLGENISAGRHGNATLTAIWTPIRIFQSDESTLFEEITFNPDGTIIIPDPVQEGFIFSGWFLDAACTIPFNPLLDSVSSDLVLYAKWTTDSSDAVIAPPIEGTKLSPGAIAGIVIGSVALVSLTLALLYFFVLKKKGFTLAKIFGKKVSRLSKLTAQSDGKVSKTEESPKEENPPSQDED